MKTVKHSLVSLVLLLVACTEGRNPQHVQTFLASFPSRICNVMHHGSRSDAGRYETLAIQAAIDECSSAGGGTVLLPGPGKYLTAALKLKSNVHFHLEAGAILLAGTQRSDYPPGRQDHWYLLLAENATNVAVTGPGEINGQSEVFVVEHKPEKNVMISWNSTDDHCLGDECRPHLLGFANSSRLLVHNLLIRNPAYWGVHFVRCNDSWVEKLTLLGDFNTPNNDGIDIDGSNNTHIHNCHIDTGDDAICPKTFAGPTFNLTASNCYLHTKSCAVKLGSGSNFTFANLLFSHLTIADSHRGLGIQLRDEGSVHNVTFEHITLSTRYYHPSWWGRAEAISITAAPRYPNSVLGSVNNVTFRNITALSENGVVIVGMPEHAITGLHFDDVKITIDRWTPYEAGLLDLRPSYLGLLERTTAGFLLEHVGEIAIKSTTLTWGPHGRPDWGMTIATTPHTVENMWLEGFRALQTLQSRPMQT